MVLSIMNSKITLIVGCVFLLTIIGEKLTIADNEFKTVPKLYEEIGCKEIKSASNTGCTSYECPDFTKYDKTKCYLNGKTFNVGDDIADNDLPNCRASCRCIQNDDEAANIVCADIECPENFHRDWNCVSQYDDLKQCCRSGEICDETKIRSLNSCDVGGKSYRIGERIYPDNSCYECLCTLDFNNQTSYADNSNCIKINCGMELKLSELRQGCVPVYWKTPNCCAIEFKCPSKDDAIETQGTTSDGKTCKFGELTINRGDSLKSQDNCMKCKCSIPPFLTCIKSC